MGRKANGAAETATAKTEMTIGDLKKHIKSLRKAKEVVESITALKRNTVISEAIDAEIQKAKDYGLKITEKLLMEL